MFSRLHNWINRRRCYVIADASDSSITFSKELCRRMDVFNLDKAKVMVIRLRGGCYNIGGDSYAFVLNPSTEQETQLADIQYNAKYKCIGFECLVPTVERIFFDYGIPAGIKAKLSVMVGHTASGMTYYELLKP